jgi:hypothetical protein
MRKFTVFDGERTKKPIPNIGLSVTNAIILHLNSEINTLMENGDDFKAAKAKMIAALTMATAHMINNEGGNMYRAYTNGLKMACEFLIEQDGLK